MKYMPDLETFKEIAARGKYNILPVSCEILSDILTPIEAMKILKNVSTHCYMLESVGRALKKRRQKRRTGRKTCRRSYTAF